MMPFCPYYLIFIGAGSPVVQVHISCLVGMREPDAFSASISESWTIKKRWPKRFISRLLNR